MPTLATPLADSVTDLQEALLELDRALDLLRPAEGHGAPGAGRVKVTVRSLHEPR